MEVKRQKYVPAEIVELMERQFEQLQIAYDLAWTNLMADRPGSPTFDKKLELYFIGQNAIPLTMQRLADQMKGA